MLRARQGDADGVAAVDRQRVKSGQIERIGAVGVDRLDQRAVDSDVDEAAPFIGVEANGYRCSAEGQSDRVPGCARLQDVAAAGPVVGGGEERGCCLVQREAVVAQVGMLILVAAVGAAGKVSGRFDGRRMKAVGCGHAARGADKQNVRTGPEAVQGQRAGQVDRALEVERGHVAAVEPDLGDVAVGVGERLVGDRVAGEVEPDAAAAGADVAAARGVGFVDQGPAAAVAQPVDVLKIGLERAGRFAGAVPGFEVVEVEPVLAAERIAGGQDRECNRVGAGAEAVVDPADGLVGAPVGVDRLLQEAVDGHVYLAALVGADQAEGDPVAGEFVADGGASRVAVVSGIAPAGRSFRIIVPVADGRRERQSVVTDGRIELFDAQDAGLDGRAIGRRGRRRRHSVYRDQVLVLAQGQQMEAAAKAGEADRFGHGIDAEEVDAGQVLAVDEELGRAGAVVFVDVDADAVPLERQPGSPVAAAGVGAAAGHGAAVDGRVPVVAVEEIAAVLLQRAVGNGRAVPGIEEVEIDALVGGIGINCRERGQVDRVGGVAQTVEDDVKVSVLVAVEVDDPLRIPVEEELDGAAVVGRNEADVDPGANEGEAGGAPDRRAALGVAAAGRCQDACCVPTACVGHSGVGRFGTGVARRGQR